MRSISFALIFVLLCLGIPSALAQGSLEGGLGAIGATGATGSTGDYSCWMCPVCGYIVQLGVPVGQNAQTYTTTLSQVTTLNPNDPSWYCPSCYYYYGGVLTFAGNFVLAPCQDTGNSQSGYSQSGNSQSEDGSTYGQPGLDDSRQGPPGSQGQGLQSGLSSQSNPVQNPVTGSEMGDETADIVSEEGSEELQGKVLMILCPEDFQNTELDVPKSYFEERGLEVDVASKGTSASSMDGETITADLTLSQVKPLDYSAIIFVGGDGIELQKVYDDQEYLSIAKRAGLSGRVVGAICLGPNIIANAGLLQGKKATGSDTDYLASKGAEVVYEPVVRDGNIITGSGPDASQEFAEAVAAAISESSQSNTQTTAQSTTQSTAQSTGQLNNQSTSGLPDEGLSDDGLSGASSLPFSGNLVNSGPLGLTGSEQSSSSDSSAAEGSGSEEILYKCSICSYVYDPAAGDPDQGIAPGTPFEDLPSSYKCPLCGAGKDSFTRKA